MSNLPNPSKPVSVIEADGKSHRTKAELASRKRAEEALLTGQTLKEDATVRKDPIAHKTFKNVNQLLKSIEKADALYGAIINRYCLLTAECVQFEEKRENFYKRLNDFEVRMDDLIMDGELSFKEAYGLLKDYQKSVIDTDKELQAKRKMLFDIEKECCMTVASALRSIPKKAEKAKNPLLEALLGGD